MLSYSCPLSWRVKAQQGLSAQSSALHLLSPSCPGKSTGQPGGSHPSFPVSLPGSVPEHPPSHEEGPTGAAPLQHRMPWGPLQPPAPWDSLPPPACSRCHGKRRSRPGAGPAPAQPPRGRHWRSRAAILSIFGQMQRRVPRPPASLRLFEVSLGALICLPPAASPAPQFLVESLLTAPLPLGPRGTGGARAGPWGCEHPGSFPEHPARGLIPCPAGQWGSAHAGTAASLWSAEVAPQPCHRGCSSSLKVCRDGGRQCSSHPKSSQGQCLALPMFWCCRCP